MQASLVTTLSPFIPIVWLMISLAYLKMAVHRACLIGLSISFAIATTVFGMDNTLAAKAGLEGALFALVPIVWIIFAALFSYNLSILTGAVDNIRDLLSSISNDRRIQVLLIAWGLGGFMESVAGYGTAVAVPAAILISIGFDPWKAAVACLFSNTVAVAFGVVGIPVNTLAEITDLPLAPISMAVAIQLMPFVLLTPIVLVTLVTNSFRGLKGVWLPTLAAGISFGAVQYVVAREIGPELAAIAGSISSIGTIALLARKSPPSTPWRFADDASKTETGVTAPSIDLKSQIIAWMPYIALLVLVLATSRLVPPVHNSLASLKTTLRVYDGTGGKPIYFLWVLTPGTLVMIAGIIGGLIQKATAAQFLEALKTTLYKIKLSSLTIVCIVAMAKILGYSGMTASIAVTLAGLTGIYYPLFAPLIGAIGTFLTGSDTSSNILFGLLQKQTALQLNMDPIWIAAANTSGGCIGKLLSTQNMAVAAIATGLHGREGDMLAYTMKYAAIFLVLGGAIVFLFA